MCYILHEYSKIAWISFEMKIKQKLSAERRNVTRRFKVVNINDNNISKT